MGRGSRLDSSFASDSRDPGKCAIGGYCSGGRIRGATTESGEDDGEVEAADEEDAVAIRLRFLPDKSAIIGAT